MKWWELFVFGVAVTACVVSAFLVGRWIGQKSPTTPIEEKSDTMFIHDTFTQYKPKYITKTKLDTVPYPVTDTLRLHDTLFVFLEREQVMWRDSLCEVYASGVMPNVDSVVHFTSQMVIENTKVVEKIRKTRWGVGVQIGGGVVVADKKVVPAPYVGIGVSYNIFSW